LVVEVKDTEPKPYTEFDHENIENRNIINVDPTATVMTTTVKLEELVDPEEGDLLFHSHMWVKGSPLHLIVNNEKQKKLISAKVIKQLGCQQNHTCIHTTLGGFTRDDIFTLSNNVSCPMAFIPSRMR